MPHNPPATAEVFTRCTRRAAVANLEGVKSCASVLIAEEDRSVVLQLQAAFEKSCPEWPVLAVDNGEHALAYLRGTARLGSVVNSPITTVLLLSLTIGRVTAFQILDWMKRQRALRSVIIALMCGAGEMPEVERTSKYGAHALLHKPILLSQIAAFVSAVQNAPPASEPVAVAGETRLGQLLSIAPVAPLLASPGLEPARAVRVPEVVLLANSPSLPG